MKLGDNNIDVVFSKKILASLYQLKLSIDQLDIIIKKIENNEMKQELIGCIDDMKGIIVHELMEPIYDCHRSLGSVAEPGGWFKKDA